MIKTLSIEQKFYDRCVSQKPVYYGLIISGSAKDDECVFLLLTSTERDFVNIENINAAELKFQCQKICRMLPAGSRVSGVYYCGPLNLARSGTRIKEILYIVHQAEKHPLADKFVPLMERDKVFLHVDPNLKSLTAKAIGFSHPKDFLRPVDVKVRPVINRWRAIKTHINLTLDTYLPADRQKEKIFRELQETVTPFLEAIAGKTRLLINGDLRSESDLLFKKSIPKPSRLSKRCRDTKAILRSSSEEASRNYNTWDPMNFALFGPDFLSWQRTNSSSSLDSGHGSDALATPIDSLPSRPEGDKNLTIHGRIPGLAYLPVDGTTVADALKAFQRDLTHSILLRLELLTEELQISGGELESARILLPSRVLVRIPACPACPLSDYKFISETPDDVVRRVSLFCHPLGSATPSVAATPCGSGDRLSTADSGEGSPSSSDSEFNSTAAEEEEVLVMASTSEDDGERASDDAEPVFDAACLDTELERTFDDGTVVAKLSDVDIITDMEAMAQSVSQSKARILLIGSAIFAIILGLIASFYPEILPA